MDFFTNLISEYGLLAMFLIILLEYACFPVSSEIVLPFSGAIACATHIHFFVILTASVIAGLIGTTICYVIGLYGGSAILQKLVKKFPKSQHGIDSSYQNFEKYGASAVCFARVIPLCRTYIAFISGTMKQNYSVFLLSSFIGITIWNTLLIGTGYFLQDNWKEAYSYYDQYKHILIPVILLLLFLLLYKKVFHRKGKQTNKDSL
ncbi:DedA family protein [Anaerosporobacter faecicola]|uniref:DedA family protein n=1 Tax=Anaerosporobacter faecicola TaxID=2718714 RepID=UPI00143A1FC1|nr:DedA family protein [Anaerosporobacter faecicola]